MSSYNQPQMSFINFKREFTPEQIKKCERSFFGILRNFIIPTIDASIFDPINKKSDKGLSTLL